MNLAEAMGELKRLQDLSVKGKLHIGHLQVGLLHAYHHLHFAWNIRYIRTPVYAKLTKRQFDRWGKYPKAIEKL
jgi:hypothetical protein